MTDRERARIIEPIVPEAAAHNLKVLTQIRSLSASLFGVAAGILGLESLWGFAFYALGTILVSALVTGMLASGPQGVGMYFEGVGGNEGVGKIKAGPKAGGNNTGSGWGAGIWAMDVFGGLSSFVLTWTLFYGLVRS